MIAIAYPWFNQWLYFDLARITRKYKMNVTTYKEYVGRYRFFRYYPEPTNNFYLSDGYLKVELDCSRNMIVFGQIARTYKDFYGIKFADANNTRYEFRGFVFPAEPGNLCFVSFTEELIRYGIIRLSPGHWSGIGTVLAAARVDGRPFAARALIAREGHSNLYNKEIPVLSDDIRFLDSNSEACNSVLQHIQQMNAKTVFEKEAFMWGDPESQT